MRFLYLHGFASSPSSRKAQLFRSEFARYSIELEVPALDQRDFSHLTISGQLELLEETLRSEPAVLLGSSMGGYLAALYAAHHPEVARLALLAPAFGFTSRWREMAGEAVFRDWQQSGWRQVYHYGDRAVREIHFGLFDDALRYPENPDFSQPAMIFHGVNDAVVPVEFSRMFVKSHPNTQLLELSSDHELADVLEIITAHVMPFLLAI